MAVRGFHVYRQDWVPQVGQQLSVEREYGNAEDRFAITAIKHGDRGARNTDAIHLFRYQTALMHRTSHVSNLMCLLINVGITAQILNNTTLQAHNYYSHAGDF